LSHFTYILLEVRGGTSMGRLAALLIVCFTLIFPFTARGESHNEWKKLDDISDEALQMVKHERYGEAKQLLEYFSNEFLKVGIQSGQLSMDELRTITVTHNHAMEAVSSSSMKHEDRIRRLTQFRLVIDAVHSEHQPLWTEMESSIMTTFNQMKTTLEEGDFDSFQHQFHLFLNKYDTIHPSVRIDVKPESVQRMDAHIQFLQNSYHNLANEVSKTQQIQQMEMDLKAIFKEMKEDETDPSLIWVMISTGSTIVLTLIYVGWKKYIGDREKSKSKSEE
jgi:sporulation protein YpjB